MYKGIYVGTYIIDVTQNKEKYKFKNLRFIRKILKLINYLSYRIKCN